MGLSDRVKWRLDMGNYGFVFLFVFTGDVAPGACIFYQLTFCFFVLAVPLFVDVHMCTSS